MREKKLPMPKKDCFLCFEFTLKEFTEEQIKVCAEHWLNAENCPNWCPVKAYINNKRIIWVDLTPEGVEQMSTEGFAKFVEEHNIKV